MRHVILLSTVIAMVVCATSAIADHRDSPMRWNKRVWESDLMRTPLTNTHRQNMRSPKRVRHVYIHQNRVQVDVTVLEKQDDFSDAAQTPFRPKFIVLDGSGNSRVRIVTPAGSNRQCLGMVVLTWTDGRAVSRCNRSSARVRTPGQ